VHPFFIAARRQPTRLSRACALLLTGTVLMLAVLAASPAIHHWLHADADHADHECAITLYAQGVTTAVAGVALAVVVWRLLGESGSARIALFLSAPRFLHLPGRAPPRG
jgi:ABC-type Co2+ transport system permease subunit